MTDRAVHPGSIEAGFDARSHGAATTATPDSVPSQLGALSSLHTSGAISDDEFARAKERVLDG
ncbi:SHOCT domain-containing protein [Conyzicola nivalis]